MVDGIVPTDRGIQILEEDTKFLNCFSSHVPCLCFSSKAFSFSFLLYLLLSLLHIFHLTWCFQVRNSIFQGLKHLSAVECKVPFSWQHVNLLPSKPRLRLICELWGHRIMVWDGKLKKTTKGFYERPWDVNSQIFQPGLNSLLRTNLWKHLLSATSAVEERLGHWSCNYPLASLREEQMESQGRCSTEITAIWTSLVVL